ncbi:unnamed protein product [Arabis nemorensis]|uniref:Uncharacterized protein n=1 Tax=Arabis nemorensis TaxID=586526 RepID=A0A565BDJ5_9BRAS|nr:unnamed protein product [Arabis nemorensis]
MKFLTAAYQTQPSPPLPKSLSMENSLRLPPLWRCSLSPQWLHRPTISKPQPPLYCHSVMHLAGKVPLLTREFSSKKFMCHRLPQLPSTVHRDGLRVKLGFCEDIMGHSKPLEFRSN